MIIGAFFGRCKSGWKLQTNFVPKKHPRRSSPLQLLSRNATCTAGPNLKRAFGQCFLWGGCPVRQCGCFSTLEEICKKGPYQTMSKLVGTNEVHWDLQWTFMHMYIYICNERCVYAYIIYHLQQLDMFINQFMEGLFPFHDSFVPLARGESVDVLALGWNPSGPKIWKTPAMIFLLHATIWGWVNTLYPWWTLK